ncbi:hypothetical protein NUW54_g11896 [Trametes sanguinea]|uniref:Uncharacterized protein n=1 Tax=Trametes sanguinea TaxID=158606 RepID=A0ACC1N7H3_9APHY|nr:hypothetical protein NUW54_g11896 [Trametes sanguinea]
MGPHQRPPSPTIAGHTLSDVLHIRCGPAGHERTLGVPVDDGACVVDRHGVDLAHVASGRGRTTPVRAHQGLGGTTEEGLRLLVFDAQEKHASGTRGNDIQALGGGECSRRDEQDATMYRQTTARERPPGMIYRSGHHWHPEPPSGSRTAYCTLGAAEGGTFARYARTSVTDIDIKGEGIPRRPEMCKDRSLSADGTPGNSNPRLARRR